MIFGHILISRENGIGEVDFRRNSSLAKNIFGESELILEVVSAGMDEGVDVGVSAGVDLGSVTISVGNDLIN